MRSSAANTNIKSH